VCGVLSLYRFSVRRVSSRIRTGNLVEYAGSPWRVLRVLGVEAVLVRSDTGAEVSVDPLAIRFPEACPALPSLLVTDELAYSEDNWAEATRRHDLVTALAGKASRTTADVATAAMSLGVTPRHVWGLLRRSRANGLEIAGFLPSRRRPRAMRLGSGTEAIIEQAIDRHYAKLSRPGLQSLVREVAGRCKAADLPSPSAKAVKARVRARDQVWLARRREGPGKARSLALLTGAHPGAAAPWERVQIDSTPCDIRLVAETERTVIGRPTITFAIDIYSRTILGFSVSLQSASTITVATCLAHACLPKRDWLAQRDLANVHWPVWGKPLVLEYDQGPENEAKGIQRGLRLHGIRSKVRQKGHPEHHGTIERLIGTMMRRIHERRGTTFGSINERGDAEPDRLACLSLPELEQVVVLEIDHYNHSAHAGISDRPLDRYLAWYQQPNLPDDQRIPPLLPAGRFLLDFLPYERRRLVRTGFRLFRVDYSARDLLGMWKRQNQAKIERIVVYDPRSLATVWVIDDEDGEYVSVPYRVPRADMTLAESVAARRKRQALKAEDRTETRLFEAVSQVRAVEERGRTATSRMKAERSRQARRAVAAKVSGDAVSVTRAVAGLSLPTPRTPMPPAFIEPFVDVEDL
jgi:putative transposase